MNEHDSERIAGLLEADGLERDRRRRRRRRRRAQHLLHPGERRQQALRHPRPPQVGEGPRARACRSWSAAAWPRRTATSIQRAGAARRRGVRHPQRAPGRRPAPRGPSAAVRSPRSSRRRSDDHAPSRRPCRSGARCPTRPGSRSRSAATTAARSASCPPVRGKEISRPFDEIVGRGRGGSPPTASVEVTLLGQNVNSYGRDLHAGAGPACSPTSLATLRVGAVDGIRRVRYTSPHPKDLRPETIAAMAETPAVCEHLHLPLQAGQRPGAGRHAPRLHRRALPRAPGRGPGRASPTWPSPPTSSSASPARPTTTSSARSRWWPRPSYDSAYTFIYSPRPGTEAADRVDEFVPPERGRPSGSSGCGSSSSARRWPATEARVGRIEEVLVEGPSKKDPTVAHRPHPPEQARALRRRDARSGRAPSPPCGSPSAGAAPPARRAGRGHRAAAPPHRHPRARRLITITDGALRRPGRRVASCRRSLARPQRAVRRHRVRAA